MKFLILDTHDPYLNLAIEEYLFNTCDDDIFMLWQNEPTVVIGKNQNAFAEIHLDFAQEQGVHIARRITGGGAVYHDLGNVNYTFISPNKGKDGIDFAYFTQPIVKALSDMGLDVCLSGRNDLLAEGKKISGNAQHAVGDRVLHHGTLLFDSDLDVLTSVLSVNAEKLKAKAVASARSRVTNIRALLAEPFSTDEFIERIAESFKRCYAVQCISAPSLDAVHTLRARNISSEWLFPDREFLSRYQLMRTKRYDFGTVEIYLDMFNETIREIRIRGDFFGTRAISELENSLQNVKRKDVERVLKTLPVGEYIFGMTAELLSYQIVSNA